MIDINLIVNAGQRPDTRLKGQGDHITSYTTIIQAILSSAANDMDAAIKAICAFAEKMLSVNERNHFNSIKNNPPTPHTHAQRNNVYKILKKLDKETANMVNQELRYAKMNMRVNYLAALATSLLQALQKNEFTTVFSDGRDKSSSEGATAKTAAHALAAFNQLCSWCEQKSEFFNKARVEQIIHALSSASRSDPNDSEENHIVRYGISALSKSPGGEPDNGKTANALCTKLNKLKNNPTAVIKELNALRDKLKNVEKIAGFVGDLYDYHRVLKFDLKKVFPLPKEIKAKKSDKANTKYWDERLGDNFNRDNHRFKITGHEAVVTRIKIENLFHTIERHMDIITTAFPNLVDVLGKQNLKEQFISNIVLVDQGWNQHQETTGKPLTLANLKAIKVSAPLPVLAYKKIYSVF